MPSPETMVLALEIHHRIQLVHQSVAQPPLSVLCHLSAGIPSVRRVAAEVVVLADGRTTHLHPWLVSLHPTTDGTHDAGDVLGPFRTLPRLGIADVVQVDAVDVVAVCNLLADVRQIVRRARQFGVHISLVADFHHQRRVALLQLLTTVVGPFPYRYRHHPCMQFHAAAVTFVDGELQGVVARRPSRFATHAAVPRFQLRRIYRRCPDACL